METMIPVGEVTAFCKDVERRAEKVAAAAVVGNSEKAGLLALELVPFAMTTRHQYRMEQEQAEAYALTALRVDATSASNSETGFEREE